MGTYYLFFMTQHMLTRKSGTTTAHIPFFDGLGVCLGRVHEFCGNARRSLAAVLTSHMQGPVFWLQPAWQTEHLHTDGLGRFANPGRVTFITPQKGDDLLWTMEEVLRSGIIPLVIADLPAPPSLTAVRRLHLAAETGAQEGKITPLGLLLTPETGGAPGVESRWEFGQAHDADHTRWHLHRRRARRDPQKSWTVEAWGKNFTLHPFAPSDKDVTPLRRNMA